MKTKNRIRELEKRCLNIVNKTGGLCSKNKFINCFDCEINKQYKKIVGLGIDELKDCDYWG